MSWVRAAVLCGGLLVSLGASAQTMTFTGNMGSSIGNLIYEAAVNRGLVPTAAQVLETTQAATVALGDIAAGAGVAVGAEAAWPLMLAAAGVAEYENGSISMALNQAASALSWLWGNGSNGGTTSQVEVGGTSLTGNNSQLGSMPGSYVTIWSLGPGTYSYLDSSSNPAKVRTFMVVDEQCTGTSSCVPAAPFYGAGTTVNVGFTAAYSGQTSPSNTAQYWVDRYQGTSALSSVQNGSSYTNTYQEVWELIPVPAAPLTAPYTPKWQSPASAVAAIPASDGSVTLSPDMLKDLVNTVWKAAAAQDSKAIPYPADDPISVTEAQTYITNNPTYAPTINDWAGPAAPAGSTVIPVSVTVTPSGTTPVNGASATSPSSSPSVSLCTDPNSAACADLGTGSASGTVAASAVNVSLTSFNVGGPSGTCPQDKVVTIFGQDFSFSWGPACTFAQDVAPFVLALCGFGAALIVIAGLKA